MECFGCEGLGGVMCRIGRVWRREGVIKGGGDKVGKKE